MRSLSIVCIGKNEANNLERLANSLTSLIIHKDLNIETIYVDSASSDKSVDIAKVFFDKVIILQETPFLCASMGRWAGTLEAKGDWVLYLDADMELCNDFISVIRDTIHLNPQINGFIGDYVNIFEDNTFHLNRFGNVGGGSASSLGGASILRRDAVLDAGNWNPSFFSFEELELYSRLDKGKGSVMYFDVKMIRHHTRRLTTQQKLYGLFFPDGILGKKYYGLGQIVRIRSMNGTLLGFCKYHPEPFALWLSISTSLLLFAFSISLAAVPLIGVLLWIFPIRHRSPSSIIIYLSALPRVIMGWRLTTRLLKQTVDFNFQYEIVS